MKVFVSTHGDGKQDPRVETFNAAVGRIDSYNLISEPSEADIVLFLEHGDNKFRGWASILENDTVVMGNLERCFVSDYTDRPIPFLPGVYFSMPRSRLDLNRVVACDPWYEIPSETLREIVGQVSERKNLFSFRGFNSHTVRASLAALARPEAPITRTFRWWDYAEAEAARLDYLTEIAESSFVLCPRGLGTSTLRTYETMQLGRVPVIISDDWIPSAGAPWELFSIRVPERDVAEIPELLRRRRDEAESMGAAARDAWETWMRPGPTLARRWLQGIEAILDRRPPGWSACDLSNSWRSPRFQWRHGIHPVQGAIAAAKRRDLVRALRTRRRV